MSTLEAPGRNPGDLIVIEVDINQLLELCIGMDTECEWFLNIPAFHVTTKLMDKKGIHFLWGFFSFQEEYASIDIGK